MATRTGRFAPPEFQVLRATPQPWLPEDSLLVGRLLAFRLTENSGAELVRHALAREAEPHRGGASHRQLSRRRARPCSTPSPSRRPRSPHRCPPLRRRPPLQRRRRWPRPGPPPRRGWPRERATSTTRRGSGGSIRRRRAATATAGPWRRRAPAPGGRCWPTTRTCRSRCPAVWYELHLIAAGLDVQGVTIPGAPFVVSGHNARVAWGLTASGVDAQDLVLERIDLARKRYLTPGGWQPVDVEAMEIPVRGGRPVPFEILAHAPRRRVRRRVTGLGGAARVAVAGGGAAGRASHAGAAVGRPRRRHRRRTRGGRKGGELDRVPGRHRPDRACCRSTGSTPTSRATSATSCPARCRSARPVTGACRPPAGSPTAAGAG